MKKYTLPLALVGLVTLQACNQQNASAPESAAAPTAAEATLETSEQRLSYGIAYGLGSRMVADSVPMDADAFILGFRDALGEKEARLTPEEIQAEMQAYQEKAMADQQALQEQAGAINEAAAAKFMAENSAKEGVVVTQSGLQYEILEAGEGSLPTADDQVEVHYRGSLLDGTEFDSSYSRGQPVSFGVSQVIPGWTEALQLMPVGSKWKLYIPPALAYGPGGAGEMIGPNAALVFEVQLLSIASAEAEAAQ